MGRNSIVKSVQMLRIATAWYEGRWFPHLAWFCKSHAALAGRHVNMSHRRNATAKVVETTMMILVACCTVRSAKTR